MYLEKILVVIIKFINVSIAQNPDLCRVSSNKKVLCGHSLDFSDFKFSKRD